MAVTIHTAIGNDHDIHFSHPYQSLHSDNLYFTNLYNKKFNNCILVEFKFSFFHFLGDISLLWIFCLYLLLIFLLFVFFLSIWWVLYNFCILISASYILQIFPFILFSAFTLFTMSFVINCTCYGAFWKTLYFWETESGKSTWHLRIIGKTALV